MIGEILSHYRVLEPLGSGGMGEVFVAEDVRLGRRVALKFLPPELAEDSSRLERFDREARTLARLRHPSIVTLYEVEEHEGRPFLVMELVDGRTLDQVIPRHGLSAGRILEFAIPVADALVAAHEAGVIHRDLKPSNVLVGEDGTVKVCDFGLAAPPPGGADPEETTATLTAPQKLVGTLPYVAPEQLRGVRHDPRSDLFSFGVMLYEMAIGERPFHGESNSDLASEILHHDPPSTSDLRPSLPADLGRIVRHCLQKDPDRRYQTAKGLRAELLELAETLGDRGTRKKSRPEESASSSGRRLPVVALVGALILAGVAGVALWRGWPADETAPLVGDSRARALLDQATTYERRGDSRADLSHAEDVLRRALSLEPDNPYLQSRLAALLGRIQRQYPQEGRSEEIEALSKRAVEADPDLAPAWMARAQLALIEGRGEAAEGAARRAIAADPSLPDAYGLLGEALLAQARPREAVEEAARALEIEGEDVWGRLALAKILMKTGRYNEAASEYEKVLEYAPGSPNALSNLGLIYVVTGRELEAVPLLRRAMEEHPSGVIAANLGYAFYNLGRFEAAIEVFETAHRLEPDRATHKRNLADSYEALGDVEGMRLWLKEALTDYDRALDSGGPQPRLLGERAVTAAKLDRPEEAQRNIEIALAQSPSDVDLLFFAAQVAALNGNAEELRRRMREALAAGSTRALFQSDSAFSAYRDEEWFTEILLGPGS